MLAWETRRDFQEKVDACWQAQRERAPEPDPFEPAGHNKSKDCFYLEEVL